MTGGPVGEDVADLELIQKLRIEPGAVVAVIDPPPGYEDRLRGTELSVLDVGADPSAASGRATTGLLFAADRAAFERRFDDLVGSVSRDGRVCVAYRKRPRSDLNRNGVLEVAQSRGWRPVYQIAIDDDWSAMRLRRLEDVGR